MGSQSDQNMKDGGSKIVWVSKYIQQEGRRVKVNFLVRKYFQNLPDYQFNLTSPQNLQKFLIFQHWNPVERPTFCEIVEDLDKILSITANEEYLDLGLPQLETPPSSSDEESDDDDTKEKFPHLL